MESFHFPFLCSLRVVGVAAFVSVVAASLRTDRRQKHKWQTSKEEDDRLQSPRRPNESFGCDFSQHFSSLMDKKNKQ